MQNILNSYIRKLIKPLRSEEELIEILKKRLTKKEYKLLNDISQEIETSTELTTKLIKKLNQEKLKQELMI
jgi:hypothetical protein